QAIDETGRKDVAAADAGEHVELRYRRGIRLSARWRIHPGDRAPAVAVGGVHLAQRRRHRLNLGVLGDDLVDHVEEGLRIQARLFGAAHFGTGDAQALLQVFLVADQHVYIFYYPADDLDGLLLAAPD